MYCSAPTHTRAHARVHARTHAHTQDTASPTAPVASVLEPSAPKRSASHDETTPDAEAVPNRANDNDATKAIKEEAEKALKAEAGQNETEAKAQVGGCVCVCVCVCVYVDQGQAFCPSV